MDILKNPIILGLLAAVVTYGFLYWKEQQRQKDNPDLEKKSVNIMIPGVVGAVIWFIAGSFGNSNQIGGYIENNVEDIKKNLPVNSVIHKFDDDVELKSTKSDGSADSKSFKLVKKGNIQLPGQDVFMDLGSNW